MRSMWCQASGWSPRVGVRRLDTFPDRRITVSVQFEVVILEVITHSKLRGQECEDIAERPEGQVNER